MAPKAKPHAKGGAHPKAKVKAKAKARLRAPGRAAARAKAKAKAKGGAKARAGLVGQRLVRRRPAALGEPPRAGEDLKVLWDNFHTVRGQELSLDWVMESPMVVIEEAKYFHGDLRIAGEVLGSLNDGGRRMLRLRPLGTLSETILRMCSGQPDRVLRVHLCHQECNEEESAEDLIHAKKIRRMKGDKEEEPWTSNLQEVKEAEKPDELGPLREAFDAPKDTKEVKGKRSKSPKKKKKERKVKEKDVKTKDKKEVEKVRQKEKKERSTSEESSGGVPLDGTRPKRASQKTKAALFAGTGMDPTEKVRNKVTRAARRFARRKGRRKSSSSGSSKTSSDGAEDEGEDTLFSESSKLRGLSENFPGALAYRALNAMQDHLLQGVGLQDSRGPSDGVAVQYYRQVLAKKSSGAIGRELLTLAAGIDQVARGRASQALDLMVQRYKSVENTLSGMPWQISQKMELLPNENASLSELREVKDARKEHAEEYKTRWYGSQGEGKSYAGKGGRGKGSNKSDGKTWDRKGKGSGKDKQKKEEGGAKSG